MKKIILAAVCVFSSLAIAKPHQVTVNCSGTSLTMPLYQDVQIGNKLYNLLVGYEPGVYLLVDISDGSNQKCSGPVHLNQER